MQAHMRRSGQPSTQAMSQMLSKQMAALKNQQGAAQLQAMLAANLKSQAQKTPTAPKVPKALPTVPTLPASLSLAGSSSGATFVCEICDTTVQEKEKYLNHLQVIYFKLIIIFG